MYQPKWSGVSEKMTPIVFLKVNMSLSLKQIIIDRSKKDPVHVQRLILYNNLVLTPDILFSIICTNYITILHTFIVIKVECLCVINSLQFETNLGFLSAWMNTCESFLKWNLNSNHVGFVLSYFNHWTRKMLSSCLNKCYTEHTCYILCIISLHL